MGRQGSEQVFAMIRERTAALFVGRMGETPPKGWNGRSICFKKHMFMSNLLEEIRQMLIKKRGPKKEKEWGDLASQGSA